MKSLEEQLQVYGAYHRTVGNLVAHFLGVPLVTFSLFLLLGWFRCVLVPDIPLTAATIFYVSVFLYYLRLDWRVALLQAPFTLALLWLADWAARLPATTSAWVFAGTFLGGWAIQLLGHALEGRRPALADNLLQLFNAPLFLTVEVLHLLGLRKDLRAARDTTPAEFQSAQDGGDRAKVVPGPQPVASSPPVSHSQ